MDEQTDDQFGLLNFRVLTLNSSNLSKPGGKALEISGANHLSQKVRESRIAMVVTLS